MADADAPRSAGSRRLERPALAGRARPRGHQLLLLLALGDVLVDGRADDLPARVRLRVRVARATVGGYEYVEFVGTGTVATAVLFSSAFPAMFGTFVKYQFQRTYDAILAAPVDTEELVTAEALWIATRAGVYGCVPDARGDGLRARPELGHARRAVHRFDRRLRLGVLRHLGRRLREVDRELQLRRQRRADAALPRRRHVLPARRSCPSWAQILAQLNPLYHCVELVRHAVFGFEGWIDVAPRRAYSCVFGLRHVAHRDPRDDAEVDHLEVWRLSRCGALGWRRAHADDRRHARGQRRRPRVQQLRRPHRRGGLARGHRRRARRGRHLLRHGRRYGQNGGSEEIIGRALAGGATG